MAAGSRRFDLGRDVTGEAHPPDGQASTKREVLPKIETIRARHAAGLPVTEDKRTTAEYLAHWLDNMLPGTSSRDIRPHGCYLGAAWLLLLLQFDTHRATFESEHEVGRVHRR